MAETTVTIALKVEPWLSVLGDRLGRCLADCLEAGMPMEVARGLLEDVLNAAIPKAVTVGGSPLRWGVKVTIREESGVDDAAGA